MPVSADVKMTVCHLYMNELMRILIELQSLEFDETVRPDTEKRVAELRAKIPAPILGHYDRLLASGKKGVAPLRNQTCAGCHIRVPVAVVFNLKHGEDVCLCENCGRYLYLPEIAAAGGEAPTHRAAGFPRIRRVAPAILAQADVLAVFRVEDHRHGHADVAGSEAWLRNGATPFFPLASRRS